MRRCESTWCSTDRRVASSIGRMKACNRPAKSLRAGYDGVRQRETPTEGPANGDPLDPKASIEDEHHPSEEPMADLLDRRFSESNLRDPGATHHCPASVASRLVEMSCVTKLLPVS